MSESFDALKDKIVWAALAGMVGWMVFLSQRSLTQPTKAELRDMMKESAPYLKDRAYILDRIEKLSAGEARVADQLDKSIRETFALRIDLERMLAVSPGDVYQRIEGLEKTLEGAVGRIEHQLRRSRRKAQKEAAE
jgi:hypothetical protein